MPARHAPQKRKVFCIRRKYNLCAIQKLVVLAKDNKEQSVRSFDFNPVPLSAASPRCAAGFPLPSGLLIKCPSPFHQEKIWLLLNHKLLHKNFLSIAHFRKINAWRSIKMHIFSFQRLRISFLSNRIEDVELGIY